MISLQITFKKYHLTKAIFQNIELIRLLNDSFPGNFYFMDDVKAYAKKTEGEGFLTNNYKASFVEQEICFSKICMSHS